MGPQILKKFYSCTIESILTGCITAWYGNCLAFDCKALQWVIQNITGAELPAIQDFYTRRCQRKVLKFFRDSSHQSRRLFSLLPLGKQYRCVEYGTNRTLNSFYLIPLHINKELLHYITKSMWTTACQTSHSKIMGINVEFAAITTSTVLGRLATRCCNIAARLASIQPYEH